MNPTAEFLRKFNAWRRGEEIDVASPFEIGQNIDNACELIEQRDELLAALKQANKFLLAYSSLSRNSSLDRLKRRINRIIEKPEKQ